MLAQPTPGSNTAIDLGCTCPVLDNRHGLGYLGQEGLFVYIEDCPIHGSKLIEMNKKYLEPPTRLIKVFRIVETVHERTVKTYEVEAVDEDEAINMVEQGKVEPLISVTESIDQEITDVEELPCDD